jgi:hypothetical protein
MRCAWNTFWFKTIDARRYAVLRIAFGGLSAIYLALLLPYAGDQFSRTGWLGQLQQLALQNGGSWSLFFLAPISDSLIFTYLLFALGIIAALLLMIGWHSRLMAFFTWLIWVSLWNRNSLLLDGDDAVLKLMCFYLMLSPCGNNWSIDKGMRQLPEQVPVWPLRLIQFQIALIYFVSGWVKFHSPEWLNGDILRYVLVHPQYSSWDGWSLLESPVALKILAGLADFIRWWEVLFPILLLNVYTRGLALSIGVLFHLGLLITMNLRGFPVIMLCLYPALLPGRCMNGFSKGLRSLLPYRQLTKLNGYAAKNTRP